MNTVNLPRKLVISCATLQSGGAERVISILSTPLAAHYSEVIVVLWISEDIFYQVDDRVKLIDIEKLSGKTSIISKMIWFRHYINKEKPDLLVSFLYPWSIKVLLSLLFMEVKVVVAERQDPRRVRGGWIVKTLRNLLYIKTKGVLVQTYENQQFYPFYLRHKMYTIYNPILMNKEWVGKAINTKKENIVCSVGRLGLEKNHIFLIKSFIEFHKSHPDYKLALYGDGELKEKLQAIVEDHKISHAVYFMGNRKDVFECILNSKIFVLPSKYEGMPNALIEAMCLGLPCISTRVSGATELIKHGKNGLLVDVDNQKEMLYSLNLLANDENMANEMAMRATRIYTITNSDMVCNKWIDYIDCKIEE